jgi:hypothetical protein
MTLSIPEMILLFCFCSLLISVIAVVYSYVLTFPGEIFFNLYKLLHKAFQTDEREAKGLYPHPIFKLLIACEKCVAGQIALWSYLALMWPAYLKFKIAAVAFGHIGFVAMTIFLTVIMKKLYQNYTNDRN